MDKNEALKMHRILWTTIATDDRICCKEAVEEAKNRKLGESYIKSIAFEIIGEKRYISNRCYMCEYCNDECDYCPLDFGDENCSKGIYGKWHNALFLEEDFEKAKELALKIANLPEKEIGTVEIQYEIECFDRTAFFEVPDDHERIAREIIDEAYRKWCDPENNPRLEQQCCEESICWELEEAKIPYTYNGSKRV